MLLFREIYGWLRYLISKDPLCESEGIVVEEIYSTFAPFSDVTDGIRTLCIHRIQDGMTPRLEYRAIGLHPQLYWYDKNSPEGILLNVTNQFGFPNDWKSWDCSTFCQYLLCVIKDKLCLQKEESPVVVTVAGYSKTVQDKESQRTFKLVDETICKRIVESITRSFTKGGTKPTRKLINDWLLKNTGATAADFVFSLFYWLDDSKGKWPEWKDFENLVRAGVVEQSQLYRLFKEKDRLGYLPPEKAAMIKDMVISATQLIHDFNYMLKQFSTGEQITDLAFDKVKYGMATIASFKSGKIPFQYLQQLELCDPYEMVLPWSFVRRNVLSYNKIHSDANENLIDLILQWLKDSHLLLLLYKGDPKQEEALTKALVAQLEHHIKQTLYNKAWMKSLVSSLTNIEDKNAFQVEFDMWLMDALSPTVKQWKLPLSPYAFSVEQKDQNQYNKIYKAWEKIVKDYLKDYKKESGKRLIDAISSFYTEVVSLWKTEELKEYKTKIPSASKILNAITKGDKSELLNVLVEDFENEIGSKIPEEIKNKLLFSPYFNAIDREVRLQNFFS